MVFQQNLLENAYFIAKMPGLAMVRLASSDLWKAKHPQTKFQILFCKNHAEKQITPCESTVYYQRGFI